MRLIAILLIFVWSNSIHCQDLYTSIARTNKFLWKITTAQAKSIHEQGKSAVNKSFFHQLIDTIPIGEAFIKNYNSQLATGHYLIAGIENENLIWRYFENAPFEVQVLQNNTDLVVHVVDRLKRPITNAVVAVKNRKLRYDKKSKNYISRIKFKKEALEVSVEGHTSFLKVNNTKIRSKKEFWRRALYSKPQRYLVLPIRYILKLPFDGYKSIRRKGNHGVIRETQNGFEKFKQLIRCTFSKDPCKKNYYFGYAILSKPKYKVGDTLKVKTYLTDRKNRPLEIPIGVNISGGIHKDFGKLEPVAPGSYEWTLVLDKEKHKLKLDKKYWVNFLLEGKKIKSAEFKLEQYDLKSISFSVDKNMDQHIQGKPFFLKINAQDENKLRLKDARVEVKINTVQVRDFLEKNMFVPTAVLDTNFVLDANEVTEFYILDSIFPKANLQYNVKVKLLNGNNEQRKHTLKVERKYKLSPIKMTLENDSLNIAISNATGSVSKPGSLYAWKNGMEFLGKVEKSSKFKIDPSINYYQLAHDGVVQQLYLSKHSGQLSLSYARDRDSIVVTVNNPRKLPFSYFIYKVDNEVKRGFGNLQRIVFPARNNKIYTFSIEYVWADKVVNKHFTIPYEDYKVSLVVDQPNRIVPGQKVNLKIAAVDQKGKPIEDLDVAAFGNTSKLNHNPQKFKAYQIQKKKKKLRRNYKIAKTTYAGKLLIPYKEWQPLTHLDTLAYYKFRFPMDSLYRIEYPVVDSITQVAPFVVRNGKVEKVHVVLIDNLPVYFSWATIDRPYSFPCYSGKRQITIRTATHQINLRNIEIFPHQKNIISFDLDRYFDRENISKRKNELSSVEVRNYSPYNFYYSHTFGPKPVWLEQEGSIYYLPKNKGLGIVGPIMPRQIKFEYLDEFAHEFYNNPRFRHEFYPNLIKMWEVNRKFQYFKYLDKIKMNSIVPLAKDLVRTKKWIEQKEQDYLLALRKKKYKFSFASDHPAANGSLFLKLKLHNGKAPINLFFFNLLDEKVFSHLPGFTNRIPKIGKGDYQFYVLYEDKSYQKVEIKIKPNGSNYRDLNEYPVFSPDAYSLKIDSVLQNAVISEVDQLSEMQLRKIYQHLRKGTHQGYGGLEIFGTVIDFQTNEPLIGANVVAYKNGVYFTGVSTDFDGNYKLNIGDGFVDLEFSYIGYPNKRITDVFAGFYPVDVELDQNGAVTLDEVMIVAYSVPLISQDNTTSAGMISSAEVRSLPVRNIASLAASTAGMSLSDNQSDIVIRGSRDDDTYYYIDGIRVKDSKSINIDAIDGYRVVEGAEAKKVYGIDKVILIQSKSKADRLFYEASLASSSIRNNFSDEAFWFPTLRTNSEGEIDIQTRFPDDITKWNLHFIAAKGKFAGYKKTAIKSYKPITSILSIPKFIIAGDTALANARTLNYTTDSLVLKTKFSIDQNDSLISTTARNIQFTDADVSLYPVYSDRTDSLAISYQVERADGYKDGEKRELPVLPKGLSVAKGLFEILDKDTSFVYQSNSLHNNTTIYLDHSKLNVVRRSLRTVKDYKYLCNEQLASKLLAFLHDKILAEYLGEKFEGESEIVKILDQINKRRNGEHLWGWWRGNNTSYWITRHVVNALTKAKSMGYDVELNKEGIGPRLVYQLEKTTNLRKMMNLLETAKKLDISYSSERYLAKMDTLERLNLFDSLRFTELKLSYDMTVDVDWMKHYRKETIFGNGYYQEGAPHGGRRSIFRNTIQHSLIAYRILRMMGAQENELKKIRQFFFEARQSRAWQNTYEKISIIETILPEIVKNEETGKEPTVIIAGETIDTIRNFPFTLQARASDSIRIIKSGKALIYFTAYSNEWVANPERKEDHFKIRTSINKNPAKLIAAEVAKELQMKVELKVEKSAEYVMVEIPIPAGTFYNSKSQRWRHEVHREYYDDRVVIFCRRLEIGDYSFYIDLFTKFEGYYTLNPAKVSLMYFPTFYGNNEIKKMNITSAE